MAGRMQHRWGERSMTGTRYDSWRSEKNSAHFMRACEGIWGHAWTVAIAKGAQDFEAWRHLRHACMCMCSCLCSAGACLLRSRQAGRRTSRRGHRRKPRGPHSSHRKVGASCRCSPSLGGAQLQGAWKLGEEGGMGRDGRGRAVGSFKGPAKYLAVNFVVPPRAFKSPLLQ